MTARPSLRSRPDRPLLKGADRRGRMRAARFAVPAAAVAGIGCHPAFAGRPVPAVSLGAALVLLGLGLTLPAGTRPRPGDLAAVTLAPASAGCWVTWIGAVAGRPAPGLHGAHGTGVYAVVTVAGTCGLHAAASLRPWPACRIRPGTRMQPGPGAVARCCRALGLALATPAVAAAVGFAPVARDDGDEKAAVKVPPPGATGRRGPP